MDRATALTAFNKQVRQSTAPDGTGAIFEADGLVVRRLAQPGHDGSGIVWSDLDAADADSVIAGQVRVFGDRGEKFEWKLYDYDQPTDLARRLAAAGFVAEEPESFMVAEAAEVVQALESAALPDGVTAPPVTGAAGLELLSEVQKRVFHDDKPDLRESIRAQLATAPEMLGVVVAVAGD